MDDAEFLRLAILAVGREIVIFSYPLLGDERASMWDRPSVRCTRRSQIFDLTTMNMNDARHEDN